MLMLLRTLITSYVLTPHPVQLDKELVGKTVIKPGPPSRGSDAILAVD